MADKKVTKKLTQGVPDPHGMIARIRAQLTPNCAVRLSPFCDWIIAQRMQGVPYRDIENWLIEQGAEHRISAPGIWKNFQKVKIQIEIPYAEELAERWGGAIDLDLARVLQGEILAQRARIDRLMRNEKEQQKTKPTYHDKRISHERAALNDLIKTLHNMMKSPLEALKESEAADAAAAANNLTISDDAKALVRQMLLDGDLKLGDL
jgi:hypothetical protein